MIPITDQKSNDNPINIHDLLENNRKTRNNWEMQCARNTNLMAQNIADSVAQEVFGKLGKMINSYGTKLTKSSPLRLSFSLNLKTNAAKIREWAKDAASLEPFNERFPAFENEKSRIEPKDFDGHISGLFCTPPKEIDFPYFQLQFDPIGNKVSDFVRSRLDIFSKEDGNQLLEYRINWNSTFNSWIDNNLSGRPDYYLSVCLWIKTPEEPGEKPKSTCSRIQEACTLL